MFFFGVRLDHIRFVRLKVKRVMIMSNDYERTFMSMLVKRWCMQLRIEWRYKETK